MPLVSTVFIETQVFYSSNYDFESTAFKALAELVKAGRVTVITTTVTNGEVTNQIKRRVKEAANFIDENRKHLKVLANSAQVSVRSHAERIDAKKVAAELSASFHSYLSLCNAETIDVSEVDPEVVFAKYFDVQLPFEAKKEKREEFPDAFAIEALKMAVSKYPELIIITGDKGFRGACEGYGIRTLPTIEDFLNEENKAWDAKVTEHVLAGYEELQDKITEQLTEEFQDGAFYVEQVDGDVNSVQVLQVDLDDNPRVLTTGDDSATLECGAMIKYEADISYDDPASTVRDSEDGRTYVFNTIEETVEQVETIFFELEIQFDLAEDDSFESSIRKIDSGKFGFGIRPSVW